MTDHTKSTASEVKQMTNAQNIKIGIVVAQWNDGITNALMAGAKQRLLESGLKVENIFIRRVSGSFELPLSALWLYESYNLNGVICLGCLIKGDTPHFEFISQAVAIGIMDLNIKYRVPFIFGVLTTLTLEQAQDRTGGKHGNKGTEAAAAALDMIAMKQTLK